MTGNITHLQILKQGRDVWNNWKDTNSVRPDLKGFNLDGMDLSGYHLDQTDFTEASMIGCNLNDAWLCWCVFIRTNLSNATITSPSRDIFNGDRRLLGVNLRWSSFAETNLSNATLRGSTLEATSFFDCNFEGTDISNCEVYGVSAWGNLFDENTRQNDLIVTKWDEPILTIDNLELAQFIYLALQSKGVRSAINTITTKIVLILGSFSPIDKPFLDALREPMRRHNLIPMMYDFDKPNTRNHTDTVSTLAHLSSFIIVDLTNQKSAPHELASIITTLRSVPVIPITRDGYKPYGMFEDFSDLRHVAQIINYNSASPSDEVAREIIESANTLLNLLHN